MQNSFYHGPIVIANPISRKPDVVFCTVVKIINIDTSDDENILMDQFQIVTNDHTCNDFHISARLIFIPINEIENFDRNQTNSLLGFSDSINGQDRWVAIS